MRYDIFFNRYGALGSFGKRNILIISTNLKKTQYKSMWYHGMIFVGPMLRSMEIDQQQQQQQFEQIHTDSRKLIHYLYRKSIKQHNAMRISRALAVLEHTHLDRDNVLDYISLLVFFY